MVVIIQEFHAELFRRSLSKGKNESLDVVRFVLEHEIGGFRIKAVKPGGAVVLNANVSKDSVAFKRTFDFRERGINQDIVLMLKDFSRTKTGEHRAFTLEFESKIDHVKFVSILGRMQKERMDEMEARIKDLEAEKMELKKTLLEAMEKVNTMFANKSKAEGSAKNDAIDLADNGNGSDDNDEEEEDGWQQTQQVSVFY